MRYILFSFILTSLSLGLQAQGWEPCNIALNNNNTFGTAVCVHNNTLFAANNSNGLQKSTDFGTTWTPVNPDIVAPQVELYSTGDRLYAVLHNSGCSYIQYSVDDGLSFQIDSTGLPRCYQGAVTSPSASGKAWTNHLIFSVAGPDWEFSRNTSESGWVDASYFDANDCSEFFIKNDTCWAATNGATSNGVAWSVDGINWTSPVSNGIPGFYMPAQIAWDNNRLLMMGSDVGAGGAGADTMLKYSDDYGLNFSDINIKQYLDGYMFFTATGKQPTLNMYTGYGKIYLALGNDVMGSAPELIVSSDGGQTFQKDTVGFPDNVPNTIFTITNMAFLNGWVFAQVNTGDLYRKHFSGVGLNESSNPEKAVRLYPNPVEDVLQFSKPSGYRLTNLTGKLLSEGKNVKEIDLSAQAAGVYFITLTDTEGNSLQHEKIIKK